MAIDLTEIYKKYKGLRVALKDDRLTVVASGKTVEETLEGAQSHGYKAGVKGSGAFTVKAPDPFTTNIHYRPAR